MAARRVPLNLPIIMRVKPRDLPVLIAPPLVTGLARSARQGLRAAIARQRIGSRSRLHLACGTNVMPGWANVDLEGPRAVIKLDLTAPLPVPDDTLEAVYSEHFIEHIERAQAQRLLAECHRVLKPGGVLRISTPDLRTIVDHYVAGRVDFWHDMHWRPETPARMLNESMREWGHRFLYDADELLAALRAAGFQRVERQAWRASAHPDLAGLECRPDHGELIYECTK
jgi:predicted SAM-dependent methyltransferase